MESVSVYDRFMIWAYRTLAVGYVVALIANVYKHGWSPSGMIWPILLATLLFSLGTNPARQSTAWLVRYIVAFAVLLFLVGIITVSYTHLTLPTSDLV